MVVVLVVVVVVCRRHRHAPREGIPNWSMSALDRAELGRSAARFERPVNEVAAFWAQASSAIVPLFAALDQHPVKTAPSCRSRRASCRSRCLGPGCPPVTIWTLLAIMVVDGGLELAHVLVVTVAATDQAIALVLRLGDAALEGVDGLLDAFGSTGRPFWTALE